MAWDWQVFCKETTSGDIVPGCLAGFARAATSTYLNWMMSPGAGRCPSRCCALVVALVCGLLIGTLRTLPNSPWLVRLANAWVELFRNIPLLVQIFLWYFVVPGIFPAMQDVPGFVLVVFALGFFTSARIAEQVRAGIQALPRGPALRRHGDGLHHRRRPTATCCCRWRCASSCRRSPASR